jgi:hypothetical protein
VPGTQARQSFRAEPSLCRRGRRILGDFHLRFRRGIGQQLVDCCLVHTLAWEINALTRRFARQIINALVLTDSFCWLGDEFGQFTDVFGYFTDRFGYLTGSFERLIHTRAWGLCRH